MSAELLKPAESPLFLTKLEAAWPFAVWREVPVIVAVSGGADSIALLRGLLHLRGQASTPLIVAHFNHRLRDSADDDERFVAELFCHLGRGPEKLGLALELGCPQDPLTNQVAGEGIESAARAARYEFLKATADKHGARYVATAHTADDQAETILHRILRGTGVAGSAGIPRLRRLTPTVSLVRPLLGIRRHEVEEYLRAIGQPYRNDPTNLDTSLTRNRIRHELLPLLASQYNQQIIEALLRFGDLCGQAQSAIDGQVETLIREAVAFAPDGSANLNCRRLAGVPPFLIRELLIFIWKQQGWPLQDMSHEKWTALAGQAPPAAAPANPPPILLPGNVRAVREGDMLYLQRQAVTAAGKD